MPISPPFPAIIFDFDGTLIDSAPDIARALNATLAAYDRAALSVQAVRAMVGDGSARLLAQAFAATGAPLDAGRAEVALDLYLDTYLAQTADPACLYPGVRETLGGLAEAGARLGLCTNKPERITRRLLALLGLEGVFGAVAGGDTLPRRKPDAMPLRFVQERLGREGAVMVGDGRNDVLAARAAGLPVVVVSYGYPRMPIAELGADLIIDRFSDLPDALSRLARSSPSGDPRTP